MRPVFQSTHPRGVRRDGQPPDCRCGDVSIHAPAWGATEIPEGVRIQAECFNPRTRVGCDARYDEVMDALGQFQSTHPRGVRLGKKYHLLPAVEFQSTHPRGVRLPLGVYGFVWSRFQSTHPRGVRPGASGLRHTYRRGFNPRTRVGCDARPPMRKPNRTRFQSTHPRGVRQDR